MTKRKTDTEIKGAEKSGNRNKGYKHELKIALLEHRTTTIEDTLKRLEITIRDGFKEIENKLNKLDNKLDNKISGIYSLIIGVIAIPVILFFINMGLTRGQP